MLRLSDD